MIVMSIASCSYAGIGKQLTGLRCQLLYIAKTMIRMAFGKLSDCSHGITDRLSLLVTQQIERAGMEV